MASFEASRTDCVNDATTKAIVKTVSTMHRVETLSSVFPSACKSHAMVPMDKLALDMAKKPFQRSLYTR